MPRIVTGKQPIDVAGFEITPADRARLNNPPSSAPYRGPLHGLGERPGEFVGEFAAHCLIRGLIVFCPLIMVATVGIMGVAHAGGAALDAARKATAPEEPRMHIPAEGDGALLAAFLGAHTGSETLRRGVSKRILPATGEQREFPRLMVWVESARLDPGYGGATFVVTVRSQGFLGPDVRGTEVVHQITSPKRQVDEWLASNGRLFKKDLDGAFDALITNIVSLYMLEKLKN
jgi:hypothetical protein